VILPQLTDMTAIQSPDKRISQHEAYAVYTRHHHFAWSRQFLYQLLLSIKANTTSFGELHKP